MDNEPVIVFPIPRMFKFVG